MSKYGRLIWILSSGAALCTILVLILGAWMITRYQNQVAKQNQVVDQQDRAAYVNTLIRPISSFPLIFEWQINLNSYAYDDPVYQDGLVLVPAEEASTSYWYGIDASTGQTAWQQETGGYEYLRCLVGGYLVVSGPRAFFNLETHTGKIIWQKDHAGTASCSKNEVFYSEVPRNSISAAALATGQELWVGTQPQLNFDGVIYNPGAEEVLATHAQDFYIIEPQTGLLKSSFNIVGVAPTGGPPWQHGSMYLIDRNELFLGDTVLDAQTGRIIRKGMEYGTNRPPTVTEATMYLAALDKGVIAFDRDDYNISWIYPPPQPQAESGSLGTLSAVAILNNIGYVIFSDATLRAFDLETGRELGYWQPNKEDLWNWRICTYPYPRSDCVEAAEAGLTTSEDMLFASFGDGKVYAFGKGK